MQTKYIIFIITGIAVVAGFLFGILWYQGIIFPAPVSDEFIDEFVLEEEGLLEDEFVGEDPAGGGAGAEHGAERKSVALDVFAVTVDTASQGEYQEFEGVNLSFCANNRVYMVGEQDGSFPDIGEQEVLDEMGGIWHQPFKLLDGFWVNLKDIESGKSQWLIKAETFVNLPYGTKNIYAVENLDLDVTRFQYCPDNVEGLVVEYEIANSSARTKHIELTFFAKIDLLHWGLSIDTGIEDGRDIAKWDSSIGAVVGNDSQNAFFVAVGSDREVSETPKIRQNLVGPVTTAGENGIATALKYTITIAGNESLVMRFFVTGGTNKAAVVNEFISLKANHARFLQEKVSRLLEIANRSKISIPDKNLQMAFEWAKFHTDWMRMKVPAIGEGPVAVLPSFPWWFSVDGIQGARGILAQGGATLAKNNLELLKQATINNKQGGRVVQAAYPSGTYDPGDPYEVALYISGIYDVFKWTGDKEFVARMYKSVKDGLSWIFAQDKDGDLVPDGQVAVESSVINLEPVQTAVYTYDALVGAVQMAKAMGDTSRASDYQRKADRLKNRINTEYWVAAIGRYADMYGPASKWLEYWDEEQGIWIKNDPGGLQTRIDTLIQEVEQGQVELEDPSLESLFTLQEKLVTMSTEELNQEAPWSEMNTALSNVPLEYGLATPKMASQALQNSRQIDNCCYGYEAQGSLATAQMRYGYIDEGLKYVQNVADKAKAANYSLVELFDVYPIAYPLVSYIFGIQPEAYNQSIVIKPRLPTGWNEMSIENVIVGNTSLDLSVKKQGRAIHYTLDIKDPIWTVNFITPKDSDFRYFLNGVEYLN